MYKYEQLPPLPNLLTREERENMISYLIDNWERRPDKIWALYGAQKCEIKPHNIDTQLELEFNNLNSNKS